MRNKNKLIGFCFGILFCFDRVPVAYGPAVMPPVYLFTLAYCFIGIMVFGLKIHPKSNNIFHFIVLMLLHATIMALFFGITSPVWLSEYIEFIVKLILVSSLVVCLSNIYLRGAITPFFKGICLGTLGTVVLATAHTIWIMTGNEEIGNVVKTIRGFIALPGFASGTDAARIASFSNEPSSFGALVFLFILPIAISVYKSKLYSLYLVFTGSLSFSTTSILTFLAATSMTGKVFIKTLLVIFLIYFLYLNLDFLKNTYHDNYLLHTISIVLENIPYALMVDARLGSSLFLFYEPININLINGTGVGSIHELGKDRLQPEFWNNLKIVSQGVPNLKTLIGNYIFDFGLIFTLPIAIWIFKMIISRPQRTKLEKYIIVGLVAYSFFGFSYISPILWFWIITLQQTTLGALTDDVN